jgi:PKD repeat protein
MNKNLKTNKSRLLPMIFMSMFFILFALNSKAQIAIDFNGAFPPPGPPLISNPIGTGTSDEGLVKWYRGDTVIVSNGSTGVSENAGINPGRGGVGFAACFNTWDITSGSKADLIINDVNLSTGYSPAAVLKFWMINKSGTDVIKVFARNGTDPWVQIGAASYGVYTAFTEVSISLQAFTGGSNTTVDIRFEGTSDYGSDNIGIDDISIDPPAPMTYVSSTTSQKLNDREIFKPLPNQEIIRMQINTSGTLSPVVPNTFHLSTSGTNVLANISNAKLWYTGTVNSFNFKTATPVGNVVATPSANFNITGITQALAEGQNYFFLTYDVAASATLNDTADATFDSLKVGTTNYVPTVTNPAGRRIIRAATAITQTPGSAASGSANGRAPSTGALFNRSISIIPASEITDLKNGQTISTIGFEIGGLGSIPITVSGNMKIYLINTTDASYLKSTTFATAIVGMRKVYDGPLTINPELGTYDIRLDTPILYTGANIYLAYDWNITSPATVASANSNLYACNSALVGGGNGNRSATSNTAAPTTVSTSPFRPKVRFGVTALANDAAVTSLFALTEMANPAANQHQVRAIVKNNGFNPLTSYNVNLTVAGANTYSNAKQVNLLFGESTIVTFDAYNNTTNGVNTVKVKVGADGNSSNDSIQASQNVTASRFSYSTNTLATGQLGYNTGAGLLLTKYKAVGAWLVDSVRISIANNAASATKKVFAVVLNSEGTIIAKSDTVTLVTGDLNTFKTFAITAPRTVSNEDFYVGLSQVANAVGYFPLGTQTESPGRPGAYYTASSTGAGIGEASTFGRFPIDAYVSAAGPAPTVSLGADRTFCVGDSVILNAGNAGMTYLWSTGATTQTIVAKTAGAYSVTVRNAQGNPTRDTVNVAVNAFVAASVNISQSPSGIVCAGLPVTFTATPTNGGTTPTYAWLKNGTIVANATAATYTSSSLANNDVISAVLTSSLLCKTGSPDTSNAITMQVSAGAAAVTVTAAPTTAAPYCAGSSVSFTATASNGGAVPKYKWYVNNVLSANDSTANFTALNLNNNDTVKVQLTSNSLCILGSNTATFKYGVTISPNLPVSVNVTADKDSICGGQTITFTATPTNGGGSPAYKWYRNGILLSGQTNATLATSLIENKDTITCMLTSSQICQSGGPAISNSFITKVKPLPNSNFTNLNNNRTANFTSTSTNALTYAWSFGDGGTSTSPNPTHTYAADGSFVVSLITNNICGSDTINKNVLVSSLDITVSAVTAPVSGCNLNATTAVRIRIKNNRAVELTNVPVSYQINGGAIVNEIVPLIAANGLKIHSFTTTADLSADGTYNIKGWASLPNDFDNSNDTVKVIIFNQSAPNAMFTSNVTGGDLTLTNTSGEGLSATTYSWSFGDGIISNDKNPSHTYAAAGSYIVSLIATNTCGSDTLNQTINVTAVGLNNTINAKNVIVYPNPNNGQFKIDFKLNLKDNVTLKIVNLSGQIVYQNNLGSTLSENLSIDLSELASGVYTLRVEGVNTQITKKISVIK